MPKRKTLLQKTALKLASCWRPSPLCLKAALLKCLRKNLVKEETASALKERKKASLFMSPSSPSPLYHYFPRPLFSSPRCCYKWMHHACWHHTHTISQLIVESWNASFWLSQGPPPSFTSSTLQTSRNKVGCGIGGDGGWLLEEKPEQEEEDFSCALILFNQSIEYSISGAVSLLLPMFLLHTPLF